MDTQQTPIDPASSADAGEPLPFRPEQSKAEQHTEQEDEQQQERPAATNPFQVALRRYLSAHPTDLYLYNASIEAAHAHLFVDEIEKKQNKKPEASLILVTEGGDPHAAYRIIRCLQENYKYLRIFVSGYCKSAGTLIAIGSDELVFGPHGELGPLDVQLGKPDELFARASGLDTLQAFNAIGAIAFELFEEIMLSLVQKSGSSISTKLASEIAKDFAVGLMAPISEQINPYRVSEANRSMAIAAHYGENVRKKNLKKTVINKNVGDALAYLIKGYPTHSYVIDKKEAKTLFEKVRSLDDTEQNLIKLLGRTARFPQTSDEPVIFDVSDLLRESEHDTTAISESDNGEEPEDEGRSGRGEADSGTPGQAEGKNSEAAS